ncbi:hypothetical protein [Adhaeretor mobilis]|uniref:PEP-CTERM protein-sorting domain-containing protein n=1 Tax=Adhaeretor mobilis TaxID=1930276 RepID=A0A517MTS0_9BACT|nr:hypothetical protein [Adhaeretor mobilis]QDS98262.1 hypothetical protein HG15A2_15350 [Adhaeretor mobilis]
MRSYLTPLLVVLTLLVTDLRADTNILSENFDSYVTGVNNDPDQAAFEAVWRPADGSGKVTLPTQGLLVPNTALVIDPPNDNPPGIQGQGVNILDNINEHDPDNDFQTPSFEIVPSSTQAVRLSGDMFDDTAGNKRASIGLRSVYDRDVFTPTTTNVIELGHWNSVESMTDPTDGTPVSDVTGYAYRVVLFDSSSIGAPLIQTPNWQYFPLDPILDTKDSAAEPNPDGLVTPVDIGVGWHRYTATITETTVTFELDLFRDGLANTEATEGVGTPGVDSSVTWTIAPQDGNDTDAFDYDPFNSLRIGGPSGVSGNNESVVDNISIDLIDLVVAGDNADFDGSNLVDGEDFLTLQQNFGTADPLFADGDANGDGFIDDLDVGIFQTQYGTNPNAVASAAAVPEPSTAVLGLLFALCACSLGRSSKPVV